MNLSYEFTEGVMSRDLFSVRTSEREWWVVTYSSFHKGAIRKEKKGTLTTESINRSRESRALTFLMVLVMGFDPKLSHTNAFFVFCQGNGAQCL